MAMRYTRSAVSHWIAVWWFTRTLRLKLAIAATNEQTNDFAPRVTRKPFSVRVTEFLGIDVC
jgi:hypothetical protein